MLIPVLESSEKRKRKPNIYNFSTFSDHGYPIKFTADAFRLNVREFLQLCASPEDYKINGKMPVSRTLLQREDKNPAVPLYTIEEDVKNSLNTYCDHCRFAGWSKNFLSKRRYHFIIPADENWNKPLDDGVLDDQTHLLHGLIHCNGLGHLICINGMEGGSKLLFGKEIMDLWDRICTNLRTRKVTVEDVSRKRGMDLRLLHGVAYGHPWFGTWGYKFCRGSRLGVSESDYASAIEVLSSIELDSILEVFRNGDESEGIGKLLQCYRDSSETPLTTVRDLLRTMLTPKSRVLPQRKPPIAAASTPPSSLQQQLKQRAKKKGAKRRWPMKRLEDTAQAIVDALNENRRGKSGDIVMTRQEIRDATKKDVGDTGLLDSVLKLMDNVFVGGYIVQRKARASTRIIEYRIRDHKVDEPGPPDVASDQSCSSVTGTGLESADVSNDIVYLYKTVLLGYPGSKQIELAIQAVLDSKLFVKDWLFCDRSDDFFRFVCRVVPCSMESDKLKRERIAGVPVVVDLFATVGDLKKAVEMSMKDTYCGMEDFVVTKIEELGDVQDKEALVGLTNSGLEIWAQGIGIDTGNEMTYEGGSENFGSI